MRSRQIAPSFKFTVEYSQSDKVQVARFTNRKHAKSFLAKLKQENDPRAKMFEITLCGKKGKEITR